MPLTYSGGKFASSGPIRTYSGGLYESITRQKTYSGGKYESRVAIVTYSGAAFRSFQRKYTQATKASFRQFHLTRRTVYATDENDVTTFLGELLEGQTTLADVPLADGAYTIEVRSSGNYYDEARSRIRFGVVISSGTVESQDLPLITSLTAEISRSFSTKLIWTIEDVAFSDGLKFGIWRSPTTPVDISGAADFETLAYDGLGEYSFILSQTVDEYFAVAAIRDSDKGASREVFVPWDLTPPISPPNQYAYREDVE